MKMTNPSVKRARAFEILLKLLMAVVVLLFVSGISKLKVSAANTNVRYTNDTTGYCVVIEDQADLLSSEEELDLIGQMIELTEYGNIAFLSVDSNYSSALSYAEMRSHSYFGSGTSQTVFLIDMDNRDISIYSDGANYKVITKGKANSIVDNVYTAASAKDYYRCASNAFTQVEKLLSGGKIAEPFRYISCALLAILIGMLICFTIINASSKLKTPSVAEVLGPAAVKYTPSSPKTTLVNETKRYSPQSSSSGGHSSGGGGHHSSGGGGHHSGGGGSHHF